MQRRTLLQSACLALVWGAFVPLNSTAAPATLLFEDDFNRGIPGWTQVQPTGAYIDGPMRWQYDIVNNAFVEQSNIYTDAANFSPTATAVMLINDAVAGTNFVYQARLTAGDDDAFGLIFGYANANNFFRVTFTRQSRVDAGFPWNGWNVDQKTNNVSTNLFGDGVDGFPDPEPTFRNTQYQPFDVTIAVTNGLFSLTVLDDPEGAAIEYKLVESQPIAGLPANGRVGMFTWGQSGTAIRGFRIQNPVLAPTPLVGDPNALTNWTPVVTLRSDGSGLDPGTGNGGVPIWSLALGQNGALGTLHENSDSFGSNDEFGQVDFSAASIVAGDINWTNYVMKARIIPADDDGHGILVRYQDERNFYRVALRNQDSLTGPRKGLSIQKAVDGVFEEVYFDETVKYDPVANTPYEITAAVVGNRLQVLVIGNPGTPTASTHAYGPFELTGATLANGKIGFFSWGMSRTEFDWVRVYGIDGVPLEVASPHGSPEPPVGLNGFPAGTSVTATVPSPVVESPGIRRVVTGWSGVGSVPASGETNSVTFTLNDISLLNWTWQTEHQLALGTNEGGTVTGPAGDWLPAGTNVTVTAQAAPGYIFAGWNGSSRALNPTLNVRLTGPVSLTPNFEADSDNDGIPDSWEQTYFTNLTETAAADADSDGVSNLEEFLRGTSPIAPEALLLSNSLTSRWENVQRDPGLPGQLVIRDFGDGFRGIWENSNDYREADGSGGAIPLIPVELRVPNVSFEGPRIMIRSNIWQNSWSNFTGSAIFDFGDNDGGTIYFRYVNESNWYRATITAENSGATWRAPYGLSVQKRTDGVFSEMTRTDLIAGDVSDTAYFKRIRLTVTANGPEFTVTATGWNANLTPPDWDTGLEAVLVFTDPDHPNGRFGVGTWGQSGGNTATPNNPVNAGMLIEDVVVTVNDNEVFREDWEQVPLAAQLPDGWTNAFTGAAAGNWQISAHGSIFQTANFNPATGGTLTAPRANAETTLLLIPAFAAETYTAEVGVHPFDEDGVGLVYDFQDTNNYARVLFSARTVAANGRMPQGVSISRKTNGTWSDVVAGDSGFIYTPGSPFQVRLSRSGTSSTLNVWEVDRPENRIVFTWNEPAPTGATNRLGFATWEMQEAHFTSFTVSSLARQAVPDQLRITSATRNGNSLELAIDNPGNASFDVQASATLEPGSWNTVASGQGGSTWTTPITGDRMFFRLQIR